MLPLWIIEKQRKLKEEKFIQEYLYIDIPPQEEIPREKEDKSREPIIIDIF